MLEKADKNTRSHLAADRRPDVHDSMLPLLVLGASAAWAPAHSAARGWRASQPLLSADLPRTPKAMVDQLRDAVQSALSSRCSRMRVSLPPGFDYGIESQRKGTPVSSKIDRSDRELARLFVEMFQGTGLVPTVCFPSSAAAADARKLWGDIEARVVALDPESAGTAAPAKQPRPWSKAQRASSGGGGFGAAKPASGARVQKAVAAVPASAEVVLVVAPGGPGCEAVRSFCEENGADRLVVLLNARSLEEEADPAVAAAAGVGTAGEEQREYVDGEFANVYAFVTDPAGKSEDAPAVLFKRSAAEEWSLVSKPKVGPPRELLASDERPSAEAMRAALDASAAGGLLGAISSALGG
mmetsp:Transcript_5904/g.17235  ORF Transcript_5904/g.17235 Transcript_5904/m.17235 type:complete len:355 (-) Transcript_5904:219-1283(-)